MRIKIITTLFLLYLAPLFAIQVPDFSNQVSWKSNISESQVSFNNSSFKFDPVLEVNTNRGTFETSIEIMIPANLLGLNSIKLLYNSNQVLNSGMGVGWSWNLPQIFPSVSKTYKNSYSFTGLLGSGELTQVDEDFNVDISKELSVLNAESIELSLFRPSIDQNFSLFVQVRKLNKTVGWIILTTSGKRWVLNSNGSPLALIDLYGNSLDFSWNEGVLEKISSNRSSWSLGLVYSELMQDYPIYKNGSFYLYPKSISKIEYREHNAKKDLLFTYDSEYLVEIRWRESLLTIFSAEYFKQESVMLDTKSNNLKVHDDRVPVFKDANSDLSYIENYPSSLIMTRFIDFNGDGAYDIFSIDNRARNKEIESYYKNLSSSSFKNGKIKSSSVSKLKEIANINPSATIAISYRDSKNSDSVHIIDDALTEILSSLKLYKSVLKNKSDSSSGVTITYKELNDVLSGIFFVDINGDSKKDLIYCPADASLSEKKAKLKTDPYNIKGKKVNREHSNLILSILSQLGLGNISRNKYTNVFKESGSLAELYLQEFDIEKADKLWKENVDFRSNYLMNSYKLKKQENVNFKCNQYSLFIDVNSDGHTDVITGNTLYLLGAKGESYKIEDFNIQTVLRVGDRSINTENTEITYEDLDNDGKLEIYQARGIVFSPLDGEYKLIRIGKTEKWIKGTRKALLSKLYSPFRGEVNVSYKNILGQWVVSEVSSHLNTHNLQSSKKYNYIGMNSDPYRAVYTGFSNTETIYSYNDERIKPYIIKNEYSMDLTSDVLFFETRGRLNGLLLSSERVSAENQLDSSIYKSFDWDYEDLGSGRIFPYIKISQEKHYEKKSSSNRKFYKSKTIEKEFPKWLVKNSNPILPLRIKTSTKGHGLSSPYTDKGLDGAKTTYEEYNFFDDIYRLSELSSETLGKDEEEQRHPLKVKSYNSYGEILSLCKSTRCQGFEYDALGRIVKISSDYFDEIKRQVNYFGTSPLVKEFHSEEGKTSFEYDPITSLISKVTEPKGVSHINTYNNDSILDSTIREFNGKSTLIYKIKNLNIDDLSVDIFKNGINEHYFIDGFGRFYGGYKNYDQDKWFFEKSLFSFEGDLISKTERSFGIESNKLAVENFYDHLGRFIEENTSDGNIRTNEYIEGATLRRLNGIFYRGDIRSLLGNKNFEYYKGMSFNYNVNAAGDLLSMPDFGYSWEYNKNGEVIKTTSSGGRVNGIQNWIEVTRRINDDGTKLITGDSFITNNRKDGRLKSSYRSSSVKASKSYYNDIYEKVLYDKGRVKSHIFNDYKETKFYVEEYEYDENNLIKSLEFNNYRLENKYDEFDRLKNQVWSKTKNSFFALSYGYDNGIISKLKPIIKSVKRNPFGAITELEYESGIKLIREYEDNSTRLKKVVLFSKTGEKLFSQGLRRNDFNQVIYRYDYSSLNKKAAAEVFNYDEKNFQLLSNELSSELKKDDYGRVKSLNGDKFYWEDENLISIKSKAGRMQFYYDAAGEIKAACKGDAKQATLSESNCFIKVDQNSFIYKNEFIQLIEFEKIPVAVVVNSKVYTVVSDALGSIRAMVSLDSKSLKWYRKFSPWGKKSVFPSNLSTPAKELEEKTVWNFALLLTPPQVDTQEGDYYWSKTRVYTPEGGRWLSVDPGIKWNPSTFLNKPGNWFSTRYANNDPLNYVDPSGMAVCWGACIAAMPYVIGGVGGGIAGGIAAYSLGGARNWDLFKAIAIGAGAGFASANPAVGWEAGAAIGAAANFVNQLFVENKTLNAISTIHGLSSIGVSALSGGIGAFLGGRAASYFRGPSVSVTSVSLNDFLASGRLMDNIINSTIGGFSASTIDIVGQASKSLFENSKDNFSSFEIPIELKYESPYSIYNYNSNDY